MLYIFFSLVLLIPVLMGFGGLFQKKWDNIFTGISSKLLLGIFSVSMIWTVVAFFSPLNIWIETSTIIIGLSAFFYFKAYKEMWKFLQENSILFSILFFITIFFASFPPFILDHFGYYVPTVKWISEIGLVKGISNLDLLLGQMSFWHIFQAGFSNFSDSFLRINVLVLVTYLIYIFEKKSWIHLVFLPVLFLFSQSPSPDLPVIVFSLMILKEAFGFNKNSSLLFAFSIFVFAIKPTMIWLPVFVFLYSFLMVKSHLKFTLFGVFVLGLFVFKNLWTFGFPVFPVQFFDFGISWKPNPELLKNSSEMAILKTYDMQFSYDEISKFSTFDYIKNWLFLEGIKGKIHLFFILSLVAFFLFSLKKKSKIIWLVFISVLVKSILVILFSAQYRFFIDVFFVVFFVIFHEILSKKFSVAVFFVLSVFFAGFLSFPDLVKTYFPSFRLGSFMTGFDKAQFYKPSHFTYHKFKTYEVGNLKFNMVKDYVFSFDTPLPAISPHFVYEDLEAGIFPQLKGNTLKDGFVWRKISNEEKIQIQKILEDFNKDFEK